MLPVRLLLELRGFLARSWWLSRGLYRLHGNDFISAAKLDRIASGAGAVRQEG